MNTTLMAATPYVVWGIVLHLFADWILQNEWMALEKVSLRSAASWVHGAIHLAAMWLIFPWPIAVVLAAVHIGVDTRVPLAWWRVVYKQTREGPSFIPFAMWQDQTLHITSIAVAAIILKVWT